MIRFQQLIGVWGGVYFVVAYFVYQAIVDWRYKTMCQNVLDCNGQSYNHLLILLVIIPLLWVVLGIIGWKKQNIFSKLVIIFCALAALYFFKLYLTPPMLG